MKRKGRGPRPTTANKLLYDISLYVCGLGLRGRRAHGRRIGAAHDGDEGEGRTGACMLGDVKIGSGGGGSRGLVGEGRETSESSGSVDSAPDRTGADTISRHSLQNLSMDLDARLTVLL